MSAENNNTELYSPRFHKTIDRVMDIALDHKHDYVALEHLALGLVDDPDAQEIFKSANIDRDELRQELKAAVAGRSDLVGTLPDIAALDEVRDMLARAEDVYPAKGIAIDGAIALAGIVRDHRAPVSKMMRRHGLTMNIVGAYMAGKLGTKGVAATTHAKPASPFYRQVRAGGNLDKYAANLNEQARQGKIDPLIGRDEEVARALQVLGRRKKNNPMLVGEPGVGKTAIAEGMARRIIEGDVEPSMRQKTIFSLNVGAMVAGTKYRGEFEERLENIINEIQKIPDAILFIDEIHTIIGAGSASGQALDAGNILKPALQRGDVSCIGATTYQEYKNFEKKDQALMRRFQKIDVSEPSVDQTIDILRGLKARYENHHKIEYTDEAIEAMAKLSDRYIHSRKLPDKAIDVMDEVAATKKATANGFSDLIEVEDVENTVARMAGMPPRQVSSDDKKALQYLDSDLKQAVFDQDEALEELAGKIRLARAGLRDHTKPIGNYLFSGPTGVGKTEAVNQLSQTLGLKLQRFDMSEYMEKHTVARLIGSPPGYVGHEQGGLLTDAIDKNPYSILLVDEVEKAHPDVHKIFLQIMDNGKLTDSSGKEVSFRNTMIVMTTNAGAEKMQQKKIGYGGGTHTGADTEAINKSFPPEFRNRLDAVIKFHALKPETMGKIVDKFIGQLSERLAERNVTMDLAPEARDWLGEKGYDKLMGARPLARLIEKQISGPLSEEILYGNLQKGGKVRIEYNQAAAGQYDTGEPEQPLRFFFNKDSDAPAPDKGKKKIVKNSGAGSKPSPAP